MAGTLTVSTLSSVSTLNASSGVFATQNGMTGIAKAWVNFTGTTINNAFNVSSITKNSTGNYTINFTTAMPNANYAAFGTTQFSTTQVGFPTVPQDSVPSTTSCRVGTLSYALNFQDNTYNYFAFFGN